MRQGARKRNSEEYRIMVVDDDAGVVDTLKVVLRRAGYAIDGETDPLRAIERLRESKYHLLLLDYIMSPIHGDEVVRRLREFDQDLYILLLTGYKDLAPPLETIRALDIQGYCEKSDKFDQLMLLMESGIKSISQMRTIRKFRDGLNGILEAVPKIYQLQPVDNILEEILGGLITLVGSKDAMILIDDEMSVFGEKKRSIYKGIGRFGAMTGAFMEQVSPFVMEQIGFARSNQQLVRLDDFLIVPLVNEMHQSIGVICVAMRKQNNEPEVMQLFDIYAKQAASSVNNAFLHSLVNIKNDELSRTYETLRHRYMDTIEALRLVVDAKDIYTRGHSDRVGYFVMKIGEKMGMSKQQIEVLRVAGIFHDVGKIGTADDILIKSEKLSEEEMLEIRKHPIKGANILSAVSMFKDVVPIVRSHHERVDGRGYPDGLKGEDIPVNARVISVADAFDAMVSDRQYRSHLSLEQAKQQLLEGRGTQFDKDIVNVFIELLMEYDVMREELAWTFDRSIGQNIRAVEIDYRSARAIWDC